MIAVLVVWQIKNDQISKNNFLEFWRTKVPVNDRGKLVGEFLSAPIPGIDARYRTLQFPLAEAREEDCLLYVNVGLWDDLAAFEHEIGQYVPKTPEEKKDFEIQVRRRIVLDPVAWRRGYSDLPSYDSAGVI
jgi:hypothetical protein